MVSIRIRAARPTDAGPIARVHVDTWRTAYCGIVSADYLASLSYKDGQSMWDDILSIDRPATSTFVAETGGGEIIGFAGGGPERQGDPTHLGEIYAVYVLQDHQRRGVGRRLAVAVTRQLLRDGFVSMLVWVLEDNHPACRFYETLGGKQVGRQATAIGGADLMELSYGWKDIAGLSTGRVNLGSGRRDCSGHLMPCAPSPDPLDPLVASVDVEPDDGRGELNGRPGRSEDCA